MNPIQYELKYYCANEGKSPFKLWFDALKDEKTKSVIDVRLGRLRIGNFGNCTSLGKGIFELKIYCGPGYRIYFALQGNRCLLLLCGGNKSTQKKDIRRARNYWNLYSR